MVTFAVTVPAAVAVAAALILVGVATCKLPRGREAPRSVIPTQAFFAYRQGERKGERASERARKEIQYQLSSCISFSVFIGSLVMSG